MTLFNLPSELLPLIGRELDDDCDFNAFIRTCRRFYNILNPELYRRNVRLRESHALLWAAQRGRVETVRRLVAEGADVNKPEELCLALLDLAELPDEDDLEYIDASFSPLMISVGFAHDTVTRMLIEHGANIWTLYPYQFDCCTILHMAAKMGSFEIVELLLERGMNVDEPDDESSTPLHYAMKAIHDLQSHDVADRWVRTVAILLRSHADVDARNGWLDSPKDLVLGCQHVQSVVQMLLYNVDPQEILAGFDVHI